MFNVAQLDQHSQLQRVLQKLTLSKVQTTAVKFLDQPRQLSLFSDVVALKEHGGIDRVCRCLPQPFDRLFLKVKKRGGGDTQVFENLDDLSIQHHVHGSAGRSTDLDIAVWRAFEFDHGWAKAHLFSLQACIE